MFATTMETATAPRTIAANGQKMPNATPVATPSTNPVHLPICESLLCAKCFKNHSHI